MKRLICLLSVIFSPLLMTSCEVHNNGQSWDVPWHYIAIPVTAFSVICLTVSHIYIIHNTYKCPECGTEFKPRWHEISAWIHINDDRIMRCPCCHRKGFCKKVR